MFGCVVVTFASVHTLVQEDWEKDSHGEPMMSFHHFYEAAFELLDGNDFLLSFQFLFPCGREGGGGGGGGSGSGIFLGLADVHPCGLMVRHSVDRDRRSC